MSWVKTQAGSLVNLERVSVVQLDTVKKLEGGTAGRVVALNQNREVLSVLWTGTAEECVPIHAQLDHLLGSLHVVFELGDRP